MTDQEIEQLISCHVDGDPDEATFRRWAERAGVSIERVRAIYRSVCDQRRSQAVATNASEIDPAGDF